MQQDKKSGLSWSAPAGGAAKPSAGPNQTKQLLPAQNGVSGKGGSASMYAGLFVGGLIIGILLSWGWSVAVNRSGGNTTATSTQTNTQAGTQESATSSTGSEMMGEELTVPSPQKAGQSVVIDNAVAGEPTWVVVYENRNGAPGNILGAQLFFTSGPGIVTLLRGTEAGQTYYVGLAKDNGDHKFTKSLDNPGVNTDGTLAVVSFKAN